MRTKATSRDAADPVQERRRQESRSKAAQRWYEQLLERYPAMKPAFRNVPGEQNGFLQFLLLAEDLKQPKLPADLLAMLNGQTPWEPAKLQAWLRENQEYFDQILHVAELPDRSTHGLDFDRFAASVRFSSEFSQLLTASARLAFEAGDHESALRYGKASMGLSHHMTDIEVPTSLGQVVAAALRHRVRKTFLETILPGLTDNPQALTAWRDVLFDNEPLSREYVRMLTGEWNVGLRHHLLPELLGDPPAAPGETSIQISDSDAFFEHYTATIQRLAAQLSASAPNRLNLAVDPAEFPKSAINPKTDEILDSVVSGYAALFEGIGANATSTAMIAAAVALQLGEEPPVDPVSGKPFRWDPESRTVSAPEGVDGPDPIQLR